MAISYFVIACLCLVSVDADFGTDSRIASVINGTYIIHQCFGNDFFYELSCASTTTTLSAGCIGESAIDPGSLSPYIYVPSCAGVTSTTTTTTTTTR